MAKVSRNFLFIGFLILGLVPTIVCILYPPTYGIVEAKSQNGNNVSINNWYNTRKHPSIKMSEKVIELLQNTSSENDQLFDSYFTTNLQSKNKVLNIQLTKENKATASASLYNMKGDHIHTTYFANSNFDIPLKNIAANKYYLLLNLNDKTFSKKITIKHK